MARVWAYITAGNNHREVSIGGRNANDYTYANLNTDNGTHSNCCMRVSASVTGDKTRREDERVTHFDVELPFQPDGYCKAAIGIVGGIITHLYKMVGSHTSYDDVKRWLKDYDNVTIGSFTLSHMLACVALCEAAGLCPFEKPLLEQVEPEGVKISDSRRSVHKE